LREYTHPSASQGKSVYVQELDQQFNMYIEDPFYFQDVDSSVQEQSSHRGGNFATPKAFISRTLIRLYNSSPVIEENILTAKTVACLRKSNPALMT
jgi:hypothetical protein